LTYSLRAVLPWQAYSVTPEYEILKRTTGVIPGISHLCECLRM
jgi:hypothetical protein